MDRTYKELSRIPTFDGRYEYLKLGGKVGEDTFGFDRYLNQAFYHSPRWRSTRDRIIIRDNGNDLGVDGFKIGGLVIVHHLRSVTPEAIERDEDWLYDPEFLICVSDMTHKAIHYGDASLLPHLPVERRPGDTKLW